MTVTIILKTEVECAIVGLSTEHLNQLYDYYGRHIENHFFSPKFKLGVWDGKVRLFSKTGTTYIYLLNEIIPKLQPFYGIKIVDNRFKPSMFPSPITDDIFAHVLNEQGVPYVLRDYQVQAVNTLIENKGGIILAGTGSGKAQPWYSKILTPFGWRCMDDIQVGDLVCTPSNENSTVVGVFPQGDKDVYELTFNDGAVTHCCLDHLWSTINHGVISTSDIINLITSGVRVEIPLVSHNELDPHNEILSQFLIENPHTTYPDGRVELQCDSSTGFNIQQVVWYLGGVCIIEHTEFQCNVSIQLPTSPQLPLSRIVDNIELVCNTYCQCIMIDHPDHLYITDDYIVTHNTIMSAAITYAYDKVGLRCLIVVPNITLVSQSADDFKRWGIDCGQLDGTVKEIDRTHMVTTWQSLKNVPHLIKQYNVVVVDECQAAKANVLSDLLNNHGSHLMFRMGMTGTMPDFPLSNLQVKIALGEIVYEIPAHELIARGVLSSIQINAITLNERFDAKHFPDYQSETAYLRKSKNRIAWIADFFYRLSIEPNGNVLILVCSIPFGKALTKLIPNAHFVSGADKTAARKQIYDLFKESDNLVVVANAQVAGTGLSIDRVFHLGLIDLGKSFIRTIQGIGRGLRRNELVGKTHCDAYDIGSNLTHAKRHMSKRIKYYKDNKYPCTHSKIDYSPIDIE